MTFREFMVEGDSSELKLVRRVFQTNKITEYDNEQVGRLYEGPVDAGYIIAGRANGPLEADIYLSERDSVQGNMLMRILIKK